MSYESNLAKPSVNIGAAVSSVTSDPAWIKKCLISGVCILIPLVGPFQFAGYHKRVYAAARDGEAEMPSPSLGEDIGAGFRALLVAVNLLLPMSLFLGVGFGCMGGVGVGVAAIGSAVDGQDPSPIWGLLMMLGMIVGYGIIILGSLLVGLVGMDVSRRIYNGESFPIFSIGRTLTAIKMNFGAYFMTWLGMFLLNMLAPLGAILCYVGLFATAPIASVMRAKLLAQWDAVVTHSFREAGIE
jgi:hypothetical protein